MGRTLHSLRLCCWRRRLAGFDLIVGYGITLPKDTIPPASKRWCDLKSDDRVTIEGRTWTIGTVWLEQCDPPECRGHKVTSGRHWLATGETVKDSLEHSTPK